MTLRLQSLICQIKNHQIILNILRRLAALNFIAKPRYWLLGLLTVLLACINYSFKILKTS